MSSNYSEQDTARGLDPDNVPTESGAALHTDTPVATGLDLGGEFTLVFPPAGRIAETAKALNDAAVGRENQVVWTDGAFRVPADVAANADLGDEAAKVAANPNSGSSSSPTVREDWGFGNYVHEGANEPAVAGPAQTGAASATAGEDTALRASGHARAGGGPHEGKATEGEGKVGDTNEPAVHGAGDQADPVSEPAKRSTRARKE